MRCEKRSGDQPYQRTGFVQACVTNPHSQFSKNQARQILRKQGVIYRRLHDGTFSVAPAHHHTRHLRLFLNRGHIEAQRTHGCHSKSSTRPEGLAWRGPECRIAEQRPNFRGEFLRKLRLRFKLLVHRQCHCRTPCNRFEGAHQL